MHENGTVTFSTIAENQVIDKNSIIVWSNQTRIFQSDDYLTIEGVIQTKEEKKELSTWVRVPSTNIFGLSEITLRLYLENKTLDEISIFPIDKNAGIVQAKIDKKIIDNNKNHLEITIVPLDSMPEWLRILVLGEYNSKQKIILEKNISFKSQSSKNLFNLNSQDRIFLPAEFPYLVTNHDRIILPHKLKDNQFLFSIGDSINTARSSFITIEEEKLDTGWNKKNEKVEWISPVEIKVDLEIEMFEEKNEVVIPLFLGNTFNKSWKVDAKTDSGIITKMEHYVGNGFGNLWLTNVNNITETKDTVNISFIIYWDSYDYFLLLLRNFTGLFLLILPIPLYFIYKRDGKRLH